MNKAWDEKFEKWRIGFLRNQAEDTEFRLLSKAWMQSSVNHKYSYQFDGLLGGPSLGKSQHRQDAAKNQQALELATDCAG